MVADEVRVVVVDDSIDAAQGLTWVLELDGYVVRMAHDGHAALKLIEDFAPHCVLLDIDMPGIDGFQLARLLRDRYGDDIVLIAVSGWSPKGGDASGNLGMSPAFAAFDHYLRKPVEAGQRRQLLPPLTPPLS